MPLEPLEQAGIWAGIAGLIIAGMLMIKEFYVLSIKPKFEITSVVNTVENPNDKYGYLNLNIINNGKQTATECELQLTIPELLTRNKTFTLFWRDPTHKATTKEPAVKIKGNGGNKLTNIFELKSDQIRAIINTQEEHEIIIEIEKQYIFIFEVNCEQSTKTLAKYKVEMNGWKSIKVEEVKISRFSAFRIKPNPSSSIDP